MTNGDENSLSGPSSETTASLPIIQSSPLDVLWDVFALATASEHFRDDGPEMYPPSTLVTQQYWYKFSLEMTGMSRCTFGDSVSNLVRASIVMLNGAPLRMQLNVHGLPPAQAIIEGLSQIKPLAVKFSDEPRIVEHHDIRQPQELIIDFGDIPVANTDSGDDEKMPQLPKVFLSHATFPGFNSYLTPDVTHLYLCHAVYDSTIGVVRSFLEVLDGLPLLKSLCLAYAIPSLSRECLLANEPIALPYLTSLELEDTHYLCTAALRLVSAPNLTSLSLHCATYLSTSALVDLADAVKNHLLSSDRANIVHSVSFDSHRLGIWDHPVQLDIDPYKQSPAFLDVTFPQNRLADTAAFADALPLDHAKALRLSPNQFGGANVEDYCRLLETLPHVEHLVVGQFAFDNPLAQGPWDATMGPMAQILAFGCGINTLPKLSTLTLIDFDTLLGRHALETLPAVLTARADNGQPLERLILCGGDLFFEPGVETWAEDLVVGSVQRSDAMGLLVQL